VVLIRQAGISRATGTSLPDNAQGMLDPTAGRLPFVRMERLFSGYVNRTRIVGDAVSAPEAKADLVRVSGDACP
jgi:hypothetical protein